MTGSLRAGAKIQAPQPVDQSAHHSEITKTSADYGYTYSILQIPHSGNSPLMDRREPGWGRRLKDGTRGTRNPDALNRIGNPMFPNTVTPRVDR